MTCFQPSTILLPTVRQTKRIPVNGTGKHHQLQDECPSLWLTLVHLFWNKNYSRVQRRPRLSTIRQILDWQVERVEREVGCSTLNGGCQGRHPRLWNKLLGVGILRNIENKYVSQPRKYEWGFNNDDDEISFKIIFSTKSSL